MEIPSLNISIVKGAVNGQAVDVVEHEEYGNNFDIYKDRTDIAIPCEVDNEELLLPYRGKYSPNVSLPGVYDAGAIDIMVYPDKAFKENYICKHYISMNNNDDIKDLIKAVDATKKLDESYITSPDSITNIPIRENDQPEMRALKMALNAKNIDIDKYGPRFGDNFPNDKRQLKSNAATLNIIKRYCNNCDMEAILTIRDKDENVPNPMNTEITISLTNYENQDDTEYSSDYSDE